MTETVTCSRCAQEKPAIPKPPMPGATGKELQEKVCADCWAEWQKMEVMVINELRLNFMDPKSQDILEEHMRNFFFVEGGEGEGSLPVPPPEER